MAIYHLHMKNISRKDGKNIIASAAYRSGERISDYNTGKCFDYTRKEKVIDSELILPEDADPEFHDREKFWNAVDKNEKRKDARLGKEIEFALPNELTNEQNIKLAKDFFKREICKKYGVGVDVSIHDKKNNVHVHALFNMRKVNGKSFDKKIRELDTREFLQDIRKAWEMYLNFALYENGINQEVDCRSYKEQGIEDLPQIHEGYKARKLDKMRKGASERVNYNRRVRYFNLRHKRLNRDYKSNEEKYISASEKIYQEFKRCADFLNLKEVKDFKKPKGEVLDALQKLIFSAKAGDRDAQYFLGWVAENHGMPKDWLFMDIFEKDAQMNKLGEDRY